MRLLSISLRNFRSHAETDIIFPERGIVGFLGNNESGKSAVLEAVLWALYGGDTTRGTKAGLRWVNAPNRHTASVTLRFILSATEYRVERSEGGAKLYDGDKILVDGTDALNKYMPGLLGMTAQEFTSSFMVKQKEAEKIADLLPTERVAFIRAVMGMGKIDKALSKCRKRKTALSQEVAGLAAGLEIATRSRMRWRTHRRPHCGQHSGPTMRAHPWRRLRGWRRRRWRS